MPKTLQAQREEEAEIAEQEELARQEQGLRDLQARQEVEEARGRAQEAAEDGVEVEERDLDEDIPDADAQVTQEDVTFNDESIVEGSHVALDVDQEQYDAREEAELTGAARDEEDLGIEPERNLDDSIPEAGSYQHTDTEAEDSSSDDDDDDDMNSPTGASTGSPVRNRAARPQLDPNVFVTMSNDEIQGRMRAGHLWLGTPDEPLARSPGNLNLSSSVLESSFVGSSPVMQRGRGGGGARGRGAP